MLTQWYPELKNIVGDVPKIFVGNKIDQREEYAMRSKNPKEAPITKDDATRVAEQMQSKYVECSALTQEGLKGVFDEAMKIVLAKKIKPMGRKADSKSEESGGCSLI
jgi:GTPase SAR1 family protein